MLLILPWSSASAGVSAIAGETRDAIPEDKRLEEAVYLKARQEEEKLRIADARKAYEVLRLSGEPEACVVYRKSDFRCLVDIGTFNERAKTVASFPGASGNRDRIREKRLELIGPWVEAAFLDHVRENPGTHGERAHRSRQPEVGNSSQPGDRVGDSLLQALYRRHEGYFGGGHRLHLDIVAATDSALLDSLHEAWRAEGADHASSARARSGIRPFSVTLTREGGRSVEPAGFDGLFARAVDAPVKTWVRLPTEPYGYLMFKLKAREEVPALGFEAARPLLVSLAYLPPVRSRHDAILDSMAKAYYSENRDYFKFPDTLLLKVWLRPAGRFRDSAKPPDTALNFRVLRHFDLPPTIRKVIYEEMRCCVGDFWGPLSMPYGIWSFLLLENRKGKGLRPFGAVRDSLHRMFRAQQEPMALATRYMNEKILSTETALLSAEVMGSLRQRDPPETNRESGSLALRDAGAAARDSSKADSAEAVYRAYRAEIRRWAEEMLDVSGLSE